MTKHFEKAELLLRWGIIVLSFGLLMTNGIVSFGIANSYAATDDNAFNDCIRSYGNEPYILKRQLWQDGPLPEVIRKAIDPDPTFDDLVRWIFVKNPNGSMTFVVLDRGMVRQDEDAQDLFYIYLERGRDLIPIAIMAESAVFFSNKTSRGLYGLLFCTQGDMDSTEPLFWNGKDLN